MVFSNATQDVLKSWWQGEMRAKVTFGVAPAGSFILVNSLTAVEPLKITARSFPMSEASFFLLFPFFLGGGGCPWSYQKSNSLLALLCVPEGQTSADLYQQLLSALA